MSKLIRVYLDDYDKPLVGYTLVDNHDVEPVIERLNKAGGGDYFAEVYETKTVNDLEDELKLLMAKEDDPE